MNRHPPVKSISIVLGAFLFCSCAHLTPERSEPPIDMPEKFSLREGAAEYPNRWWESFGDEQLNGLIDEALTGNLGLRQAAARLEQAQALARRAGADRVPAVSIEGSAARARNIVRTGIGAPLTRTGDQYGLNLATSYELDLWGRINAAERAATIDAQASRYDLETAAITLIAQVADLWYSLGSLESQLELLRGQIDSSSRQLDLIEMRFATGQANALDVWQQRGQLAELESILPQLESRQTTARHRLAILLGRAPQAHADLKGGRLPKLPPQPAVGLPADLVGNRPDLRSALSRLRAADERVAAALADRFPALRISASAGYSAEDTADLFDDWIWNIAGNLIAPLIDGGRRRAEADRARAVLAERLDSYAETILNALGEVEDALIEEKKQFELIASRQHQLDIAEQTFRQASSRYRKGLSDYLSVLQALQSRQSLERSLVESRRNLIEYRIRLYRALGGDFGAETEQVMD